MSYPYQHPNLKIFLDDAEQVNHWLEVADEVRQDGRNIVVSAGVFAFLLEKYAKAAVL